MFIKELDKREVGKAAEKLLTYLHQEGIPVPIGLSAMDSILDYFKREKGFSVSKIEDTFVPAVETGVIN